LEGEQNDYHDRMRALRDELSEKLSIVNEKINGSVKAGKDILFSHWCISKAANSDFSILARSKQGDILDLHTEEINKMQKTNLSVRNGVSSRVSEIISQSNEQVHNIHRWVSMNI
jgi:hypothetical protein